MKMILILDGETWESAENKNVTAESAAKSFYENIDEATKLQIFLKDGGCLVIGRDAVQRAALFFKD